MPVPRVTAMAGANCPLRATAPIASWTGRGPPAKSRHAKRNMKSARAFRPEPDRPRQRAATTRELKQHERRQRDPAAFPRLFRPQRPRGRAVVAARAAQRPDPDVHQCRHGAVQERLHRPREAPLFARRDRAEMRARRRQAQRPRQCRLHRAPPHLLRDARQFLVRRLLQGPRHRARLEPDHQGVRPAEGQADGDGLYRRR